MTQAPSIPGPIGRRYEIGFDGDVAAKVQELSPTALVSSLPQSTILWNRLRRADEFDVLLDSLLDMGITPSEVHEATGGIHRCRDLPWSQAESEVGGALATYCEVRIRGRLGDGVLRYLGWSHRVSESTVVRLRATDEELRRLIGEMTRVARLDYLIML